VITVTQRYLTVFETDDCTQFIVRPFTTRIEAEGAVVVAGVDAK
jgi:hypothetical protein